MEFWSRMYKIFTDLDAEWDLVFAKSHICGKISSLTHSKRKKRYNR